jgi:hypothetical protein
MQDPLLPQCARRLRVISCSRAAVVAICIAISINAGAGTGIADGGLYYEEISLPRECWPLQGLWQSDAIERHGFKSWKFLTIKYYGATIEEFQEGQDNATAYSVMDGAVTCARQGAQFAIEVSFKNGTARAFEFTMKDNETLTSLEIDPKLLTSDVSTDQAALRIAVTWMRIVP